MDAKGGAESIAGQDCHCLLFCCDRVNDQQVGVNLLSELQWEVQKSGRSVACRPLYLQVGAWEGQRWVVSGCWGGGGQGKYVIIDRVDG